MRNEIVGGIVVLVVMVIVVVIGDFIYRYFVQKGKRDRIDKMCIERLRFYQYNNTYKNKSGNLSRTRIIHKADTYTVTLEAYPYKGKNYHKLITSKTWTI